MAQEFKDYDKLFAEFKNTIFEDEFIDYDEVEKITHWKYANDIILWSRIQIREAVYISASAQEWQKFRVSLKGNSVKLKLYRLQKRYESIAQDFLQSLNASNIKYGFEYKEALTSNALEKIRLDNYIGALRRQMSLNSEYKIVKDI
jgi:hypothetical protein